MRCIDCDKPVPEDYYICDTCWAEVTDNARKIAIIRQKLIGYLLRELKEAFDESM